MSWFDSSFNFAKSALSQAQKSIDRALDINEEGTSSAGEASKKLEGTEEESGVPPISSWFQPRHAADAKPKSSSPGSVASGPAGPTAQTKQQRQSVRDEAAPSASTSTWAQGDSLWSRSAEGSDTPKQHLPSDGRQKTSRVEKKPNSGSSGSRLPRTPSRSGTGGEKASGEQPRLPKTSTPVTETSRSTETIVSATELPVSVSSSTGVPPPAAAMGRSPPPRANTQTSGSSKPGQGEKSLPDTKAKPTSSKGPLKANVDPKHKNTPRNKNSDDSTAATGLSPISKEGTGEQDIMDGFEEISLDDERLGPGGADPMLSSSSAVGGSWAVVGSLSQGGGGGGGSGQPTVEEEEEEEELKPPSASSYATDADLRTSKVDEVATCVSPDTQERLQISPLQFDSTDAREDTASSLHAASSALEPVSSQPHPPPAQPRPPSPAQPRPPSPTQPLPTQPLPAMTPSPEPHPPQSASPQPHPPQSASPKPHPPPTSPQPHPPPSASTKPHPPGIQPHLPLATEQRVLADTSRVPPTSPASSSLSPNSNSTGSPSEDDVTIGAQDKKKGSEGEEEVGGGGGGGGEEGGGGGGGGMHPVMLSEEAVDGHSVCSAEESTGKLKMELTRVSEVLAVRESRLLEMSRENIELQESSADLQRQLRESQEALRSGLGGAEEMKRELNRRVSVLEKKLGAVTKERDSLRKQLQALQTEQSQQKKTMSHELSDLLKEKEEQIAGLMEEGEALSKQQLQSNNIIKKLRAKDKQNDQLMASQRQQVTDCENQIKQISEALKKREENEKKYQDSLAQLNTIAEQQAKELLSVKSDRDGLMDKARSLETNLDSTYKELSELKKSNAVTESSAKEAMLSAELSAKEQQKALIEQLKMEAYRERENLTMQLNELRMGMSRVEQQAGWREDHLRQEIRDLQERLQEAETRNQELTNSISKATRPLLKQIENLQAANSTQVENWERIEVSLTQRLVESQAQLNAVVEKEHSALEKELALKCKVDALETQISSLRQEKSHLTASLELERVKLETLEEDRRRESVKMEGLRATYQHTQEELQKEKDMLERQLEYEKVKLEAETRRSNLEAQEKERLRSQLVNSVNSVTSRSFSRQSSSGSQGIDALDKSLSESMSVSSTSGLEHIRSVMSVSASATERLQSLLKQKEGELANTQKLVTSLERSRSAMVEDLAMVSSQNENLKKQVESLLPFKTKLNELEKNYDALLQMYGEKAEEAEELRLDIQDVKSMYRQQMDELLSQRH